MNRYAVAANVGEFRRILDEVSTVYEEQLRAEQERNRQMGLGTQPPFAVMHARQFRVNRILLALGWRIDAVLGAGPPPARTEASIRSAKSNTMRRMDYLGIERETGIPLLVIETKHPTLALPAPNPDGKDNRGSRSERAGGLDYRILVHEALSRNLSLHYGWNKTLEQVADYVRSLNANGGGAPQRAVITNGDWWIVFANPKRTFCIQESALEDVRVFVGSANVQDRAEEFFDILHHDRFLAHTHLKSPYQISGVLDTSAVTSVMYALLVLHESEQWVHKPPTPRTEIYPAVLVGASDQSWVSVSHGAPLRVPIIRDDLEKHLAQVAEGLADLRDIVHQQVGRPLALRGLDEVKLPWSRVLIDGKHPLLPLGRDTHFTRSTLVADTCPYHSWHRANGDGVGVNPPVMAEGVGAHFPSGNPRHCAHNGVSAKKRGAVLGVSAFGVQHRANAALCRLWDIDTTLCCHECVFLRDCHGAAVRQLPCLGV